MLHGLHIMKFENFCNGSCDMAIDTLLIEMELILS